MFRFQGDNSRVEEGFPDSLESGSAVGCERMARATLCREFLPARSQLLAEAPDVLVTNLRLEEYNGLHLVLLAAANGLTRSVVHSDRPDPFLVREAQTLGAFFETTHRLPD